MPLEGRDPKEALRVFADHLNRVLATTLTQTRLVSLIRGDRMLLSFRQGGRAVEAELATRLGPVGLYLGQVCETSEERGLHRLHTVEYRYTLRFRDAAEPWIRWEYVKRRPDPDARWCRHHVQGLLGIETPGGRVMLNDLHTPTGWVTIEEVVRFCIADLGVEPLAEWWNETLEGSYRKFRQDFAPLGFV